MALLRNSFGTRAEGSGQSTMPRLKRIPRLSSLLPLFLIAEVMLAAPGDLDTTFGGSGKVRVSVGGGPDEANAIARQADGKLVVAGMSQDIPHPGFSLVRYNPDGSLDRSFGNGGKVVTQIRVLSVATAVAIAADGKILAAGYCSAGGQNDFALVRYNPSGTLDSSFGGGDGIVITHLGEDDRFSALAVQPDGKILAAGEGLSAFFQPLVVIRYNTDGSLDRSFDGDGMATTEIPGYGYPYARAMGLQGGKIVVAGFAGNPDRDLILVRYLSDGSLDPSFSEDGIVVEKDSDRNREASSLAFLSSSTGKETIVLGGSSSSGPDMVAERITVWSYNAADGSPDTTFGTGGRLVTDFVNSHGRAINVQSSFGVANRILVAGDYNSSFAVLGLLLDGTIDPTFDGDGLATARTFPSRTDSGKAMLIQPDNRIVVAGTSFLFSAAIDANFAIVRFDPNGSLDPAFDSDGTRTDDVGNAEPGNGYSAARSVVIQPDGKIVVAAAFTVARFNPDASFDASFDIDGIAYCPFSFTDAMAMQTGGKLVLFGSPNFTVSRFNPNGSLDTSFGNGGAVTLESGIFNRPLQPTAVTIQSDDKIVLAGYVDFPFGDRRFVVARLLPNGTLDNSFGIVTNTFGGASIASAVAIQPDGKIVLVGSAAGANNQSLFGLARFQVTGNLDPSFSFDGKLTTPIVDSATALAVGIQAGKIVVAGGARVSGGRNDFALARYTGDGSLDSSFDGDGVVITPVSALNDYGTALATQPDGKIVVAGSSEPSSLLVRDFAVVRYNIDGSLDSSYGSGGKKVVDFNGGDDLVYALALDANGRAVVAGTADGLLGIVRILGDTLPGLPGNVSTRLPVGTNENVLIEGFIVQGPASSIKKIIVRAIGPSLASFGVTDALANPTLEIHDANNATVATNNDWRNTEVGGLITGDQFGEISASGVAPSDDLESAIVANLAPGSYTAVVRGSSNTTGTGVVDAYDLSSGSPARLANIATRGLIRPGDKLMIAGFIVQNAPMRAVIRAIGPSLTAFGIGNALPDTTLQLRNENGALLLENDDWKTAQQQELEDTGLQPTHDLEAAIVTTIPPGQYTAQVRGKDASGIGVVQVYFLQ